MVEPLSNKIEGVAILKVVGKQYYLKHYYKRLIKGRG